MARLIDADKVTATLKNIAEHLVENENQGLAVSLFYAADVINVQPTVDAVEVVHGEWIEKEEPLGLEDISTAECSACGDSHILSDWTLEEFKRFYLYCPNCGAKMDGEAYYD